MRKHKILALILIFMLILSGCGNNRATEESESESYKGNFEIIDELGEVIVTTENLKSVSTSGDKENGYCVNISFDEAGAEKFAEATKNNIGKTLYIYVDGSLISSPTVQAVITNGETVITGFETSLDAYSIVNAIKNGNNQPGEQTEATKQENATETEEEKTTEPESTEPETKEQQTETPETAAEPEIEEEVPHREGMFGISDKDIYDIGGPSDFPRDKVRNDITGNWRVSAINKSFDIPYYALSYYNKYFYNDDEVHAIVNFSDNTTTRINYMSGNLYVTVLEYVKGEEHDANLMFSGTVLSEYIIYPDNGDIEYISE